MPDSKIKDNPSNERHGRMPSGLSAFDLMLAGGWGRGRLNAVTGPDQRVLHGVLLRTVASAQARGERCLWIGDPVEPDDAATAGVDLARLKVRSTEDDSPHGAVQALRRVVEARRRFDLIVVGSMPSPASRGWKRATKPAEALAPALERTGTVCVYAMALSELDSGGRSAWRDLGTGYTRRLAEATGTRVQISARRSSAGRFRTVTARRMARASMCAVLGVDACGRIRSERLSAEGLICLGFRTSILTEPKPGFVAFGERGLGMDDGSAASTLQRDARLAGRLQRAIAKAVERDPELLGAAVEG